MNNLTDLKDDAEAVKDLSQKCLPNFNNFVDNVS
jgi:hypothetical protein